MMQGWNALRSLRFLSNCKLLKILQIYLNVLFSNRLRGAMVARLTPDEKATCSSHVGVTLDPYGIMADVDFLNSNQSLLIEIYRNDRSICLHLVSSAWLQVMPLRSRIQVNRN